MNLSEGYKKRLIELAGLKEHIDKNMEDRIPQVAKEIIEDLTDTMYCSAKQINNGDCTKFSDEFYYKLKEMGLSAQILDSNMFLTVHQNPYQNPNKNIIDIGHYGEKPIDFLQIGLPSHYWVYVNGKHYDAEATLGVTNVFDLPLFKRYYSYNRRKLKNK